MELRIPESPGWAAAPLLSAEWDQIGVVVKRDYVLNGSTFDPAHTPVVITSADTFDTASLNIVVEADTALYKTKADWHFRGYGPGGSPTSANVATAAITVNAQNRATYVRDLADLFADPDNLFGYEPRDRRLGLDGGPFVSKPVFESVMVGRRAENLLNGVEMDELDLARAVLSDDFGINRGKTQHSPELFRSGRRSRGYQVDNDALPVPEASEIVVTASDGGGSQELLSATLRLSGTSAIAYLWEGGPDKEAYWCKRDPVPLTPDTVTLTETTASVVWRAALPKSSHPLQDMRLIRIEEAA